MSSSNYEVKLAIAYAAFLHDVGKIAQRTKEPLRHVTDEKHKDLLQPGHGYIHVLYTEDFLEQKTENGHTFGSLFSPFNPYLQQAGGTEIDTVQNLANRHHKPETPFHWLIAEADRLSAGHDRKPKDEEDELVAENPKRQFLRVRLEPTFNVIKLAHETQNSYCYEIRYYNGNSKEFRFPKKKENLNPSFGAELSEDYKKLYNEFCNQFEKLFTTKTTKVDSVIVFLRFLTLCERFYFTVPSSTIDMPDINLYDHSYLIAAIATALYDFHKENGSFTIDGVRDRTKKAFRIIQGDLSGIQNYILNFKHEGQTALAKTLRARSFYLQAIAKDIERQILKELELPPTSVIVSAGSKFQILAPNIKKLDNVITELQNKIDEWLFERYMGEISFILNISKPFAPNDLIVQNKDGKAEAGFLKVMGEAVQDLEEKKFQKFKSRFIKNETWDPESFIFRSHYEKYKQNGACEIHGKFPAEKKEDEMFLSSVAIEEKQVGTQLTHEKALSFKAEGRASLPFSKLSLDKHGEYNLLQNPNSLTQSLSFLARLPNFLDTELEAKMSEETKNEVKQKYEKTYCETCNVYQNGNCEILKEFTNKSFHCLAQESLSADLLGVPLLAVFKADVDNLGKIFQEGIPTEKVSISRYSGISKSLNYFFTEYLHEVLKDYPNIYTVYAGGDDLFLLGPFPKVLEFAKNFRRDFTDYVGGNPNLSFSAGIALIKPRTPISIGAEQAEAQLKKAKSWETKNSIGIFNERLTWKEFEEALQIRDKLIEFYKDKDEILSMAMLYRLLRYVRMYKESKKDVKNIIYRSYFAYDKARNIYEKISDKQDKEKDKKLLELARKLEEWFTKEFESNQNNQNSNHKRKYLDFLNVSIQLTNISSKRRKRT